MSSQLLTDPASATLGSSANARRRLNDWVSFDEARELLRGLSVLVVDSDTEASGRVFISLGQAGASVRLARRFIQGSKMLTELDPDVLVLGTQLPDGDPSVLLRAGRDRSGSPLVVALGVDARGDRRRYAGADAFLTKPIDVRLFAQDLARALRDPLLERKAARGR